MSRFWCRASYRIAFTTAVVLAIAAFVLGGGGILIARHHMASTLDARIAAAAQPMVAIARTGDMHALRKALTTVDERESAGVVFALFDAQGRRVLGQVNMDRPRSGWSDVVYYDPVEGGDPARIFAVDLPGGERLAAVGNRRPIQLVDEAMRWLMLMFAAIILILCTSLAILLGRHLDHRLAPITRTADAVIAGELAHRVPVSPRGDEFDLVARSLNAMLDRISGLMASLRGIAGNVAHDLHTPLARLRARLEIARGDPAASQEEVIDTSIAAIDELLGMFRAVLRIAEIEEGGVTSLLEDVSLDELAVEIVEAMQPVFEEAGLCLRLAALPSVTITGDRDQLASAIINVLENALRYTSFGAIVSLEIEARPNHVTFRITDSGPGVPEGELERIFDRFVRLDSARSTDGHGLGLSLVRAITLANRGIVNASNGPGGFSVTFRFPRS